MPGAEWVLSGEGTATRKYDGTCCMVGDGELYRRYDAKKGKQPPPDFEPAQDEDAKTGHWPGWVSVGDSASDQYHREAFGAGDFENGTYELCGPKVQGNPEQFDAHVLVRHGVEELPDCPRSFEGLKAYFQDHDMEGVVWHHPDGRMVKIKAKGFGIKRK